MFNRNIDTFFISHWNRILNNNFTLYIRSNEYLKVCYHEDLTLAVICETENNDKDNLCILMKHLK